MELDAFCSRIVQISDADSLKKALCILWWDTQFGDSDGMTAGEIARIIRDEGLGNPNSTQLGTKLNKSSLTLKKGSTFRLRAGAEDTIRDWVSPVLGCVTLKVDIDDGYLPGDVWKSTRGYLEKVCIQLNGCFQYGFFDAAAVMMRRIVETLIIEAYEHLKRDAEIRGADGNFLMLNGLIDKSIDINGLALGREAKRALSDLKKTGDRSAHNRRINAVKNDLDSVRTGLRVVADELICIANLRHA